MSVRTSTKERVQSMQTPVGRKVGVLWFSQLKSGLKPEGVVEKGSKRPMTVEAHLMTLVIYGLQHFITKMISSRSQELVRTEAAVRT